MPKGVSNWTISYRPVFFDSGSYATTGIPGVIINENSPVTQSYAIPYWIGDSITAGYATSTGNYAKSPGTFAQNFLMADGSFSAAYTLLLPGSQNGGITGITSTGIIADIPVYLGLIRLSGVTFAGIMLGTNDSKDSVATAPSAYKANIQAIMAALKAVNPAMKIVLNKPTWFKSDTGYSPDFSSASLVRLSQYQAILNQLADGTSVVVGGLTAYNNIQACGWTGTTGSQNVANAVTKYPPAPTGGESYLVDGLHPYDGGAQMIGTVEWGPNAKNALFGNFTLVPAVNAGTNQNINLPISSVTLSGSASESGGTIASCLWTQVSGSAAAIVSPTAMTTQITGLTVGTYVFQLTATDVNGATGSGTVQVTVGPAATFASWATANGLTGSAALPSADPDGNSITNLVEYSLGIPHGSTSTTGLPAVSGTGGVLAIKYVQLQSDITYQPEWSTGLAAWYTTGFTTVTSGSNTTASIPCGTNQRMFVRLSVTQK